MVLRTTPIFSQKIGKESPKIVIITLTQGDYIVGKILEIFSSK
jgi:hypothetical protein